VRQVTAKNRYARALAAVTAWCRINRHRSISDQQAHLTAMMRGHYAYYGILSTIKLAQRRPGDFGRERRELRVVYARIGRCQGRPAWRGA
jgi:hypothetical protein